MNVLNPGTSEERMMRGLETIHVPFGTVYRHVTPGAGGHGPPRERDPTLVARDVRDGKISIGRARDIYRVEVSLDGAIDHVTTDSLRHETNSISASFVLPEACVRPASLAQLSVRCRA